MSQYVNHCLPPQSKLFLFRELRAFYLDVPYAWGDPVLQGWMTYDALPDAKALLIDLRRKEFTHVLDSTQCFDPLVDEAYYNRRITDLMAEVLASGRSIYRQDGIQVVELPEKLSP